MTISRVSLNGMPRSGQAKEVGPPGGLPHMQTSAHCSHKLPEAATQPERQLGTHVLAASVTTSHANQR